MENQMLSNIFRLSVKDKLPSSMRTLDISGNLLSAFNLQDLAFLTNLQHLSLANNYLSDRIIDQQTNLANLEVLNLKAVNLTTAPQTLLHSLPNLRSLDISFNRIGSLLTGAFVKSDRLEELMLNNCKLKFIDADAFSNAKRLRKLDLSFNDLETIPEKFPTNITSINLFGNSLLTLPNFRMISVNLVHLDISENGLHALDFQRIPGTSLTRLNFRNNQLKEFPVLATLETEHKDFVGTMTLMASTGDEKVLQNPVGFALEELDFSANLISSIDQIISGFQNLTILNLSNNKISSVLSFCLSDLPRLLRVDLSGNLLTVLPNRTFLRLPRLKVLNLSGNRLKVSSHHRMLKISLVLLIGYFNAQLYLHITAVI